MIGANIFPRRIANMIPSGQLENTRMRTDKTPIRIPYIHRPLFVWAAETGSVAIKKAPSKKPPANSPRRGSKVRPASHKLPFIARKPSRTPVTIR
jgi:hypothetical protein